MVPLDEEKNTMKYKSIIMIREFFDATVQEIKALTSLDRQQLGSAIARQKGYSQQECEFEFVEY